MSLPCMIPTNMLPGKRATILLFKIDTKYVDVANLVNMDKFKHATVLYKFSL